MDVIFAKSIIVYFELSAAIFGLVYWKKWKTSQWRWLIIFLFLLFLLDFIGQQLGHKKMYAENTFWYKYVVIPILFSGYFILYQILVAKKQKILGWVALLLFLCSWLFEVIFLKHAKLFTASLAISTATVLLLIFVLQYFWNLLHSEKLTHFYHDLSFWFCTALLSFYLPMLPYFGLFNLLAKNYYSSIFLPYTWVFVFMNYLMYGLFSLGFVFGKNEQGIIKNIKKTAFISENR